MVFPKDKSRNLAPDRTPGHGRGEKSSGVLTDLQIRLKTDLETADSRALPHQPPPELKAADGQQLASGTTGRTQYGVFGTFGQSLLLAERPAPRLNSAILAGHPLSAARHLVLTAVRAAAGPSDGTAIDSGAVDRNFARIPAGHSSLNHWYAVCIESATASTAGAAESPQVPQFAASEEGRFLFGPVLRETGGTR